MMSSAPAVLCSRVTVWKGLSILSDAPDRPLVGLLRPRRRSSGSQTAGLVSPGRDGLQHVAIDLAQRVARQFVEYPKTLGDLIGCNPRRDVAQDFGNDGVLYPFRELYKTKHTLAKHGVRYAHYGGFLNRGM